VSRAHLTLDRSEEVCVLTIDRPPVNALNRELVDGLVALLRSLTASPPAALVLAGRPGCFSAGLDLKEAIAYDAGERRQMATAYDDMVTLGYALPCPVVAAVTGHAIAGGLALALVADVRVAAAEGLYGLTEVRVGVPIPDASLALIEAELGSVAAREAILRAQTTGAGRWADLGVFDEITESEAVLEHARSAAAQLADHAPDVYRPTKAALRAATLATMRAAAQADARPSAAPA
jgi:enoyl-CoA hydratase